MPDRRNVRRWLSDIFGLTDGADAARAPVGVSPTSTGGRDGTPSFRLLGDPFAVRESARLMSSRVHSINRELRAAAVDVVGMKATAGMTFSLAHEAGEGFEAELGRLAQSAAVPHSASSFGAMATHYVSLIDAAIQASSRVAVFSRSGTILTAERHQSVVRAHVIAMSLIVGGSFVDASIEALGDDARASIVAGHSSRPNSAQRITTPKAPSDVFRNLEQMAALRGRFDRSAKVAMVVADRLNRVLQDRSPKREFVERLAAGVMTMGTSELASREPFDYCRRLLPDLRKCADAACATRASLDLVMDKCRKAARESSIENAREHMLEVGEPAEMAVQSCSEHNDLVRRAAPLVPVAMREAVDAATHANQLRQAALLSWPDTEAASVFSRADRVAADEFVAIASAVDGWAADVTVFAALAAAAPKVLEDMGAR